MPTINKDSNRNQVSKVKTAKSAKKEPPNKPAGDPRTPALKEDVYNTSSPRQKLANGTEDSMSSKLTFSSDSLLQGFILSEVLGKPKSMRRGRW